jgi:SAM-dependent methyltransferase
MLSRLKTLIPHPIKSALKRAKRPLTPHDSIYTAEYYDSDDIEGWSSRSAAVMAGSLIGKLHARSVIDVGCGTGALLAAFRDAGCDVLGFEYADAGLASCERRRLPVQKFNLIHDAFPICHADLVVSFEVAEHLPMRCADRYVALLCSMASIIAMSAATPGQGGTDHINEQPHSYWIEKFNARNYLLDSVVSQTLRDEWHKSGVVAPWYCDNAMIFAFAL